MAERGYIAVARGLLKHPLVGATKPYSDLEAWLWLLFEAAWRPHRVAVKNGQAREVVALERGQLTYSRSYMAEAWGWSEKRVRTYLVRLEKDGQIERQTGRLQTVITLCNYDIYQAPSSEPGRQTDRHEGRQQAGIGPEEEQDKKGRKERSRSSAKEPQGFSEWYDVYPRKVARQDALRAFQKVVPAQISAETLIARTQRYAADWSCRPREDLKYCPYPARWLNSGRFLEQLDMRTDTAEPTIAPPATDPCTFTEADWMERLELHRQGRPWPERHWGPAPGQPGCLVPSELLEVDSEATFNAISG
ncbi:hypothetical protein [Bradyrhizobium sp. SZCCHNR1070]|uniref:hypothetical protein n=1 Tax=Bradyrhizobium sp. SZCCHNR1070 TaxID=3057361 RepID=UPI002916A558|nr:hypothetical protein [Bradyrhizobium sp. SZCCHNR1070]